MARHIDLKRVGIALFTFLTLAPVSVRVYAQVAGATMTGEVTDSAAPLYRTHNFQSRTSPLAK